MPSTSQEQLQILRNIHMKLSQMSQRSFEKVQVQKQIYQDLTKIFSKFSSKVTQLSKRINEQILSPSANHNIEQAVIHHYQFLSNSLLKLGQCTKKISTNLKQEVLQPMKIFMHNYKNISDQLLDRIVNNTTKISEMHLQLSKQKENYYSISQKFQKSRQMQNKVMTKIQNGDTNQLQKFNAQIKKLSTSIVSGEQSYKDMVEKINEQWEITKKSMDQTIISYSNNQETRVSFSKRSVLSTLKLLQNLDKGFIKDADVKLKQTLKVQKDPRNVYFEHKLYQQIKQIKKIDKLQQFLTHEEFKRKQKRTQAIEQEHLQQIFKKVKTQDKQRIKQFIDSWFFSTEEDKIEDDLESTSVASDNSTSNSPVKEDNSVGSKKSKKYLKIVQVSQQHLDDVKGKIIQALPYSFYFVEELYNQIVNMPTFYCKLSDQNFYYILNTFNMTTKSMDLNTVSDINAQFFYKMVFISQKVCWRRTNKNKDKPIQLLCNHYCKNKQLFNNRKNLNTLYSYLTKKKTSKKKVVETSKNSLSHITKNIFSRKREKQIILSPDDHFKYLQQLTMIMANFNVQNQISLTFIKEILSNSIQDKSNSFEYLKGIILSKKDIQERRKIFFKTQIKEKRQKRMRQIIDSKQVAQFCIRITASRGYFSKDLIYLRLISKKLRNIHWTILSHISIPTSQKWLHLVPYDRKMQYIQMKQQVAEKSVPSATEEIITLDVNRSLHIHGQYLNPTILHTLLRIYAFYHKDISYCQGMNYIAGYLYLKTLNQESAYRIFEHLMQIRFKQLFANQFQILKIKMYQFERLLAIFHPEISQHFKRQAISPECYIVSWIITLFASSYQYTMQSYLIDKLWERFIIWGWKQFFKFVLWIFNLKKEQLIQLTYDRALHSLGQIAKSKFLLASNKQYAQEFKHIGNVQDGMQKFQVTEQLLDSLLKQYKLTKES